MFDDCVEIFGGLLSCLLTLLRRLYIGEQRPGRRFVAIKQFLRERTGAGFLPSLDLRQKPLHRDAHHPRPPKYRHVADDMGRIQPLPRYGQLQLLHQFVCDRGHQLRC